MQQARVNSALLQLKEGISCHATTFLKLDDE